MPEFAADREPIHVFEIEDAYLFKHYFERAAIFTELQEYYSDDDYRFEISADEFPEVREYLRDNYYDPVIIDDIEDFAVVKEEYTEHADILRNSVMHWTRDGYNFFVMKDPLAVEQAIDQGATKLEDTEFVLGI